MNDRWQQVEQLYHAALERGAVERGAFLAEACAGDEALRREVESLLSYEDQAENFIESPALEVAAKMMAEEPGATVVAGQMIKHYQITSPLGAGGMGEVYLAEDTRLERRVAIKFLPALLTKDKRHLRRFEQEARAVAALSHPNVCVIHEVVETGEGRHCIVMEYVEGVTLRERIAERRMNVSEAIDAAIQVASALSAAHIAGIVHRDIKPENIMLRRDGYVKILDFGLAKLTEEESGPLDSEGETRAREFKTLPGMVMGTVAYMSPEQARGLPVDARTDVWSLGVVLYEMLAGHQPFDGATPTDVIISIAGREPEPLANCAPEVPIQSEEIVNKALAKDREERYQTADDLLIDLKRLRHDLEIGAEVVRSKQPIQGGSAVTTSNNRVITPKLFPLGLTRGRILTLTALVGVLVIAGLVYARFFRQSATPALQKEIKSIAVLPLENLSGDASQDYFAEGMTESLITDLARIGAVRVISRPSVMRYKGAHKSLPEIGRELNVDALLIGSVVRSGEHLRIAVQLIEAATERNLWTNSYERDLRDVLALQRELTQDIVGKIRIKLTPQEQVQLRSVGPVNPEAYDHYLRGRFYLNRQTKVDNEAAIAALERAVATDPNFAAAYAELAQAYSWKLFLFAPGDKQWEEKAFVAAEKALALDPDSAVAHLARGRILWTPANHFPHEKAIREYRRAVALNPSLDEARNQLALVYCHIGAFDEALQESYKAITTNPNNNLAQFRIGQTLNFQGKYEQALSVLRTLPQDANPSLVGHQIAWALFNLGKRDEASATLEQLLKAHPEDTGGVFTSIQAVLAASARQPRIAENRIKLALEKGKGFGHFHHTAYHIACAYALMNKPEQATKWLEVAADDGFPCYPLFERDTNLNNLRQDVRFVTFLAKQKQQWEYYKTIL
jgi:serine/threonine protein kinase/TolB-like protein/Flp pilus assembly protein TadD